MSTTPWLKTKGCKFANLNKGLSYLGTKLYFKEHHAANAAIDPGREIFLITILEPVHKKVLGSDKFFWDHQKVSGSRLQFSESDKFF